MGESLSSTQAGVLMGDVEDMEPPCVTLPIWSCLAQSQPSGTQIFCSASGAR